ncbi:MAG: EamA family transporter [Atopobiaceae bacterium]|nr:EamA family transporter [Atopobiaceae bacterium]
MEEHGAVRFVDRPWFNKLCILLVAALWGYSFVTMKGMVAQMPVFYLIAVRNVVATVAMVVVLRGRLRALLDRRTLLVGLGIDGRVGGGRCATRAAARLLTRKRHGACEMSETWRWCSRYNPQKEETGNDKISLW